MIDIAKSKTTLENKLRELTTRAEDIEDDLRQPADDDWAENATESAGDDVLEEVGDVTLEEIRNIKTALSRIDAGTYGVCTRCGEDIAKERLEAIPHAAKCVKCA